MSDIPDLTFSMDADEEKHILYEKGEVFKLELHHVVIYFHVEILVRTSYFSLRISNIFVVHLSASYKRSLIMSLNLEEEI